ncbi:MAG: preprotein translocase subunit SecE [Spirulina sp.]
MAKKDAAVESSRKGTVAAEADNSFSATEFFKGTKEELGKVVWPSRQQLISESAAVILMVSLSATLIYLVDQLFRWVSQQVF